MEDPEPPELMDPEEVKKRILFLFFQLGGMEWRGRFCFFLFWLIVCFFLRCSLENLLEQLKHYRSSATHGFLKKSDSLEMGTISTRSTGAV